MRRALALLAACCLMLGSGAGTAERVSRTSGAEGLSDAALDVRSEAEHLESRSVGLSEGRPSKSRSWRSAPLITVTLASLPGTTPAERASAPGQIGPHPLRRDVATAPARGPPVT